MSGNMYGVENLTGKPSYLPAYSKWGELAYSEAWKSNFRIKMSAIIYRGPTIFAIGHNEVGPSSKGYWQCSIHAELAAILACKRSCEGLKMLVYRFRKKDDCLAASKPCQLCMGKIEEAGLKSVLCVDSNLELIKVRF